MATVELIYEYLHQTSLVSRREFAARFAAPFLLFRRVRAAEELGFTTRTDPDLGAAKRAVDALLQRQLQLRREAYDFRVVRLPVTGVMYVGRTLDNDVTLPHRLVSKRHAKLVCAEGKVQIADLGSKNGTFLGDRRLEEHAMHTLSVGDELRIGGVTLRLVTGLELYDALSELTETLATNAGLG